MTNLSCRQRLTYLLYALGNLGGLLLSMIPFSPRDGNLYLQFFRFHVTRAWRGTVEHQPDTDFDWGAR